MIRLRIIVTVLLGAGAVAWASASTRSIEPDGPDDLRGSRSLAQAVDDAAQASRPLHILFVHGIRATGGEAGPFVAQLARELDGTIKTDPRHPLPVGTWPQNATVAGDPDDLKVSRSKVWPTPDSWNDHLPFTVHSTISSKRGTVTIDEINYWPMLLPFKCRFILQPDHDLSGNAKGNLEFCEREGWISKTTLARLLGTKPRSGGGAAINRALKQQIMNWGIADAVIALGPMRAYLHETLDQACANAIADSPQSEFVIVSESLGSFVVLDALGEHHGAVEQVMERTANLYFFANQFGLLELARVQGLGAPASPRTRDLMASLAAPANGAPPSSPETIAELIAPPSPVDVLRAWAQKPLAHDLTTRTIPLPKQVIAFSDPSDPLTYRVPSIPNAKVVNLYDHVATDWLGLFENPVTAHTGHAENKAVWDVLMGRWDSDKRP